MKRLYAGPLAGIVLGALFSGTGFAAERVPHFTGLGLSFFMSSATAITPNTGGPGGGVFTVYDDIWGLQGEYDGLFNPKSALGYYVAGAWATGQTKHTDNSGVQDKTSLSSWNLQGGVLWTAMFAQNWFMAYGPAIEYSSTHATFDNLFGPGSVDGNSFGIFGVGGHFTFGTSYAKSWGLQGGISSFIGPGEGKDGTAKVNEVTRGLEYSIGVRYSF
jgi:hypothetical protein